jgi:hypothetical protein
MSKPVTYEAFASVFGTLEEFEASGPMSVHSVLSWLDTEGFSRDSSARRALLRELQKRNLLKPGK